MSSQPGTQSARAVSAAQIHIITSRKNELTQPAYNYLPGLIQVQADRIRSCQGGQIWIYVSRHRR